MIWDVLKFLANLGTLLILAYVVVLLRKAKRRHRDGCLHDMSGGMESPWKIRFVNGIRPTRYRFDRYGIPWFSAPLPKERHDCLVQTCEISDTLMHTDWCACGGTRFGYGPWTNQNARWKPEWASSSRDG